MSDAVVHTSALSLERATVEHATALLADHRRAIGTRTGHRALGCVAQAVVFLRWTVDATEVARLAGDNAIARSTAYRHIDEALDVVAARAPGLHAALGTPSRCCATSSSARAAPVRSPPPPWSSSTSSTTAPHDPA